MAGLQARRCHAKTPAEPSLGLQDIPHSVFPPLPARWQVCRPDCKSGAALCIAHCCHLPAETPTTLHCSEFLTSPDRWPDCKPGAAASNGLWSHLWGSTSIPLCFHPLPIDGRTASRAPALSQPTPALSQPTAAIYRPTRQLHASLQ
jgi:hypothetical protein